MPKERITPEYGQMEIQVGWAQHCDVQLGVEEKEGRSLFWQLCENRSEEIGSEVSKIVMAANRSFPDEIRDRNTDVGHNVLNLLDTLCGPSSGVWTTLQRSDVNLLIRNLRRARDSAFGKDE